MMQRVNNSSAGPLKHSTKLGAMDPSGLMLTLGQQ